MHAEKKVCKERKLKKNKDKSKIILVTKCEFIVSQIPIVAEGVKKHDRTHTLL